MSEKELISLKEAAKASGYSADYIGQLIRAGKIPGKQVYSNIAWMTTIESVMAYKNAGKKEQKNPGLKSKAMSLKRKLEMELGIIKLVMKNFKSAIPLLIIILIIFTSLLYSVFYFSSDRIMIAESEKEAKESPELSF